MHEYGLAEGVLATVRQRADGRKVAGIRVRFGVRHAVDEESMAQAFSFVAEGTEAAGAAVKLITVPATIACRDCGLTAETSRRAGRLPALRRGGRRDHRRRRDDARIDNVRAGAGPRHRLRGDGYVPGDPGSARGG